MARGVCAALAASLGVLIARASLPDFDSPAAPPISPSQCLTLAAALCALAAAIAASNARAARPLAFAALFLAGVSAFAGWTLHRAAPTADHNPRAGWRALLHSLPADASPALVTVEGVLTHPPRGAPAARGALAAFTRPSNASHTRFWLAADSLLHPDAPPAPVAGSLWVMLTGDSTLAPTLNAGERVRITGLAHRLAPPDNPGETDRRPAAAQRGFVGVIRADAALLERLPDTHASTPDQLRSLFHRARAAVRANAVSTLLPDDQPTPGQRLLAAMLLGERDDQSRELRDAFTRLGLTHLLAISGINLTILAAVAAWSVRAFSDSPRLELAAVAAFILSYLLILPAEPPILRAAIMALAVLFAQASGRRYSRLGILGWTLVLTLLWRPLDLFNPGLQLSFLCVAALFCLAEPLRAAIFPAALPLATHIQRSPLRALRAAAAASAQTLLASTLACWAVSTPCIALHMGVVTPIGIAASIVAIPLFTALVAAGYLSLLAGLAFPSLAHPLAQLLAHASDALAWLVLRMDALPGSIQLPAVGAPLAAAWTILACWWCRSGIPLLLAPALHRSNSRRRAITLAPAALATLPASAWLLATLLRTGLRHDTALRIDALSVGDGTCLLLRSGADAALWDCGSSNPAAGERDIPLAVRSLGTRLGPFGSLRTVFITHPDLDHFNSLLDAAEPLGVRTVVVGDRFLAEAAADPAGPEAFTLQRLRERNIAVRTARAGDSFTIGHADIAFLHPPADAGFERSNDWSLVARVAAAGRHALLTGDIEPNAIRALLRRLELDTHPTPIDILEAPHHGSYRPEAVAFVRRLNPTVVLQSTGQRRAEDDRWAPLRDDPNRAWHITASSGAAWAEITRSGSLRSGSLRPPRTSPPGF